MDWIILQTLQWAIPTVLGVACGFFGGKVAASQKRNRALENGTRVMLMRSIKDDYEAYVVKHEHMTLYAKELHEETYKAYRELDGNGVAEKMHEELLAKQPWIVTD